ncbi:MAG: arginase family protein [Bacteriovoracaceae bacterium]|jgi:agmatinase|nr:arginase family protein [Bacteriovoracaceae bacterium]
MKFIDKVTKYLVPAGNGVHTVHTAKENRQKVHEVLYGTKDNEQAKTVWLKKLNDFKNDNRPVLFGITLDTGGGIQRGANWGPLFIRDSIQNIHDQFFDIGDTKTIPHIIHDKYLNEHTIQNCRKALYNEQNSLPVSALSIAEDFTKDLLQEYPTKKILTLGGDHSVSYPVVKEWLKHKKEKGIKTAIIHFDAHTDLMDERLGIDICFATWAKKVIPYLDKASDLIQIGIRSSGNVRSHWEQTTGAKQFWTSEVKEQGVSSISDQICTYIKDNNIDEVYISFDIDALDAKYASATGTPETGGLEPHECVVLINNIAKETNVTGADLVEVAPFVRSSYESLTSNEPQTTLQSSSIIVNAILDAFKCSK